jgi:hypothetical protein
LEQEISKHKPIYLIEQPRTDSPKLKLIEKNSKKVLDTIYLKYLTDQEIEKYLSKLRILNDEL